MQLQPYAPEDEKAVIELWQRCELTRPWNDPRKDIQRKLTEQPELFLVGKIDGAMVATTMAGYDGHRGWVNYLAVAEARRDKGLARAMMARVEELLKARGCPKINIQIRAGNTTVIEFYKRIGYATDDVISVGKRLIPDQ